MKLFFAISTGTLVALGVHELTGNPGAAFSFGLAAQIFYLLIADKP